mgnify:CR=1 FL=1
MFFNLTWRNAKRSRSENLIYFLTMITAVAMFYIVLSLGQQDVIRFLSEIESDAVERLLTNLLPTVYLCALLFVFFLVVFANKYQLECRSRELGLYLMFGMTKIKLFIQIMTEGLITSFFSSFRRACMRWLFIRSYKSYNRAFSRAWYHYTPIKFFCKCRYFHIVRLLDYSVCSIVCSMRKAVP